MDTASYTTHEESALTSIFPFHTVQGVANFRDIGGWPIASCTTKHVQKGLVFRGGDSIRITATGITKLQELNVQTDFDLRSRQQIEKLGVRDLGEWGITRVWAPVFGDDEYTEKRARLRYELYASEDPADTVAAFVEILMSGASMMATVVRYVLAAASGPKDGERRAALFMHCTTGNNRTGVFVSLLLLLLGVPAEHVVHEYTLSEQGLAATRHVNVERLLMKGAFIEYGPDEARCKCERMVGARAESMEALLDDVGRRWGGAEGYFVQVVGLSADEVVRLRAALTADGPGELPCRAS
ncbi:putative tyrosine-protein phosphatase [Paraphoma chrysanthemicola]|uniref:Tyrosine-protein phosphatase n=1 Tax=Paraphoma chrysanthemicola TaxID=798071 RepID=A0A8K0RI05_9PLEO|nr:putative tyrosine-protein phosphatase [Paraphoma chrysanthemicola]